MAASSKGCLAVDVGAGGASVAPARAARQTSQLAGANRLVWNPRGRDATKLADHKSRGGTVEMLAAPRVPPDRYKVRLTVGGGMVAQPFEVVKDLRVTASDADLREQYALARRSHDLLTRTHDARPRRHDC